MSERIDDALAPKATSTPIHSVDGQTARGFLLRSASYSRLDFPPYINFDNILNDVSEFLNDTKSDDFRCARDYVTGHTMYISKDGKYTWRPQELIHPILYVDLVHKLTQDDNWETIRNCLTDNPKCNLENMGLPVISRSEQGDQAEMVVHWVENVEKRSLELSLDYQYIIMADISDCYKSIYTHSIAWALHGRDEARKKRKEKHLLGNCIDRAVQRMQEGKSNGIPQGSILMDFIAEIVLSHADHHFAERMSSEGIDGDYTILRYRDDYRIFVNNESLGGQIMKCLTDSLRDLGMQLSSSKSLVSNEVVRRSIKNDKLAWITRAKETKTLQQHLLIIHDHARTFPHSGSITKALTSYYRQLDEATQDSARPLYDEPTPLIGIIVDIAYRNPQTSPVCVAILSKLLSLIECPNNRQEIAKKIVRRFKQMPNTGHIQIWMQRLTRAISIDIPYDEPVCKVVEGDIKETIWNSQWLSKTNLGDIVKSEKIIDYDVLEEMGHVVSLDEVTLFAPYDG